MFPSTSHSQAILSNRTVGQPWAQEPRGNKHQLLLPAQTCARTISAISNNITKNSSFQNRPLFSGVRKTKKSVLFQFLKTKPNCTVFLIPLSQFSVAFKINCRIGG